MTGPNQEQLTATGKPRVKKTKRCGICEKVIGWYWGSKPERCPYCNSVSWDKPHDEAVLFNLQDRYLQSRDPSILGEMFPVLRVYAERIIKKNLAGNRKYDDLTLDTKASDSANKLIEYFLEKPAFYITDSWGFYLKKIVQQYMYAKRYKDVDQNEISLETPISETSDGNVQTLGSDLYRRYGAESAFSTEWAEKDMQRESLTMEVVQFIEFLFRKAEREADYRRAFLQLVLLWQFMNGQSKRYFNRFYDRFGAEYKAQHETVKLELSKFIQETHEERTEAE